MLFNSYSFICVFLPIVLIGFYHLGRMNRQLASLWLAVASVFFYGWWDVRYVGLLLASITGNYFFGYSIARRLTHSVQQAKTLLALAILANLLLLGYYKYAYFFIENINLLTKTDFILGPIILPLGISFFTFTQIAYLVDTFQGKVKESNFSHYALFVTYFPHLIAGPVLHHKEMMPQFAKPANYRVHWQTLSAGLSIFIIGLIKKIFIADTFGNFATPIFEAVNSGGHPLLLESWFGALAYTFQLYFDFSAYSDMAVGISLMFNVVLPINFNSPYQADNIIEFWRRWHMTLSRFLKDYLYIPLGGNRFGKLRRHANLMITMLLGGLWHGAGWTFIVWGGLHGFYLMINHGWHSIKERLHWQNTMPGYVIASRLLTFVAVVIGWVFFRAENLSDALDILQGMAGLHGCSLTKNIASTFLGKWLATLGFQFTGTLTLTEISSGPLIKWLLFGGFLSFFCPNVYQIIGHSIPGLNDQIKPFQYQNPICQKLSRYLVWQPTRRQGAVYGLLLFLILINLAFIVDSEFLYFQF